MEETSETGARGTRWVLCGAVALVALAVFSSIRGGAEEGSSPLALATALETRGTVAIAAADERTGALAVHRWSQIGLAARLGTAESQAESPGARLVVVGDDEALRARAFELLERAGVERRPRQWVHVPGLGLSTASVVAAITAPEGGVAVTYVVAGEHDGGLEREAVDRITMGLPRTRAWLTLWNGGRRRLDCPLTSRGKPILAERQIHAARPVGAPQPLPPPTQLAQRIERFRQSLGQTPDLAPRIERIVTHDGMAARALDGPAHRAGWYDPARLRLEWVRGVPGAPEDALADLAETTLVQRFGPVREPWFADGHVLGLVAGALEAESVPAPAVAGVTLPQILGESPGPIAAVRAARVRAAAWLVAAHGGRPDAAWREGIADEPMRERLAAWWAGTASALADEGASPSDTRRALPTGEFMRLTGSPDVAGTELGSLAFTDELTRIQDAGFEGIALEVHVPVAPPIDERTSLPLAVQRGLFCSWRDGVTLEGDGAVRAAAAKARELGLSVVLWPRFVAGPSGPLGSHQTHGTPEGYQRFGARLAVSLASVAALAERIQADGLVALEPELMPLASVLVSDVASDERRASYDRLLAARSSVRAGLARATRSFRGQVLGALVGAPAAQRVADEAQRNSESIFRESAELRVGLLAGLRVTDTSTAASLLGQVDAMRSAAGALELLGVELLVTSESGLREVAALREIDSAPTCLVFDRWSLDRARGPRFELNAATAEALWSVAK